MGKRKHQKKSRESVEGFRGTPNPELARWMHKLRSSSAAQRHAPAPRKGTRRERERQALRDQQRNLEHSDRELHRAVGADQAQPRGRSLPQREPSTGQTNFSRC